MAQSNKSRNAYEQHLNDMYSDTYNIDEAIEKFSHIGTRTTIIKRYNKRTLGTLVREKDVIAFNTGYGDWCR